MTATDTKRTHLPKTPAAAERAVRLHLAGAGFGEGTGGITVRAYRGTVTVAVLRSRFTDAASISRVVRALESLADKRLVSPRVTHGEMFLTYTYVRVSREA